MKNKYFLSLNAKIFLSLFISIAFIFTLFLSIFMISFVRQVEQESELSRKKAEILYGMYNENEQLRKAVLQMQKELNRSESDMFEKLWKEQGYDFVLKPQDERNFALRQELMKDMKGYRARDARIRFFKYFVFFSFFLVFVILEVQWLIIRRWVLAPIEKLMYATRRISSGDLSFRTPVSSRSSKNDELNILAQSFNTMAEDIETHIRNIKESEAFLQSLINSIPDGIRVFDSQYNIILTNTAYQNMTNIKEPTSHRKCFEVYGNTCPCKESQHPCTLALLTEHPEKSINVIQKYTDENGREKFFEVSAAASFHQVEDKNELRVIELVRPLDKAILFSHQQKLSAIGMLASSVAHEMRNPLGAVRLIVENILEKMDSKPMPAEEMKRYLSSVDTQVGLCIDVTSRLLKLSRKPEKEKRPVNLNEVISETASLLEYEAKKIGVNVVVKGTDTKAIICASDAEMRMVVVNLMQNAFHAMPDGGKMEITLKQENDKVKVDFEDTGSGIEAEDLVHIFEPFFSKRVESDHNEGTGLGLSIVKTIVEEYSGTISVESTVGQGTTFHLSFSAME